MDAISGVIKVVIGYKNITCESLIKVIFTCKSSFRTKSNTRYNTEIDFFTHILYRFRDMNAKGRCLVHHCVVHTNFTVLSSIHQLFKAKRNQEITLHVSLPLEKVESLWYKN